MTKAAELKTILALAGNRRLPHLEEEIFASKQQTNVYLNRLARAAGLLCTCKNDTDRSRIVYCYTRYMISDRWPEAEAAIKTDEDYWHTYCNHFGITDE